MKRRRVILGQIFLRGVYGAFDYDQRSVHCECDHLRAHYFETILADAKNSGQGEALYLLRMQHSRLVTASF